MRDYHPMLATLHPRRLGLQPGLDRAEIQRPPPTPLTATLVITPTPPQTAATPPPLPRHRTHRGHDVALVLVELDVLDDRLLDPENSTP
jgi:hypothetical protein